VGPDPSGTDNAIPGTPVGAASGSGSPPETGSTRPPQQT
jgi:hypothetical protein